jgi:hypothetical protein
MPIFSAISNDSPREKPPAVNYFWTGLLSPSDHTYETIRVEKVGMMVLPPVFFLELHNGFGSFREILGSLFVRFPSPTAP